MVPQKRRHKMQAGQGSQINARATCFHENENAQYCDTIVSQLLVAILNHKLTVLNEQIRMYCIRSTSVYLKKPGSPIEDPFSTNYKLYKIC